jgi:hypothetical protein
MPAAVRNKLTKIPVERNFALVNRALCDRRPALSTLVVAAAVLLSGCGEWRADRAFRRATAGEEHRRPAAVVADLQAVVARWPHSKAAARARREIEWLNDFEQSSKRGRGLLAWDAVRRVAAAAERFRLSRGRFPDAYEEMVPKYLPGPIRDPWGQSVGYLRTAGGYQTVCYGADQIPGGAGDDSDVLVENGREVKVGTGR